MFVVPDDITKDKDKQRLVTKRKLNGRRVTFIVEEALFHCFIDSFVTLARLWLHD